MSDEDKARLTRNIIAGLPGAEEGYTLDQFRKHLELYKDIDKAKLRENFAVFLKAIIPVAEEVGVRMAVHPDDPPRPILGLPRIVSTIEDMQWMVDTVNSMANGFSRRGSGLHRRRNCSGCCSLRHYERRRQSASDP
uniref:mannonate dehydratase n=1 Tax=Escherichia coli TaxID=562 RepID=UPI0035A6527B